ncbi:MAG: acyltransferase family protein [Deltaproteobacteria bacterium]|nr:acyltransferase family protein [Deltaproteobacteria bacterium]MBW2393700.1 acyltransferase family protein [Deltaproteobacteria bacterium]
MSDASYEPISLDRLRNAFRPISLMTSPVSSGLEDVPRTGPVLFVGNHTIYGMIDVPMLGLEIYEKTGRPVRGLADHLHFSIPGWRNALVSMGAVRGTRENCARLFEDGEQVLVFPGGGREVTRRKGEAYQLIWKERIGFARLAIEHGVPIVPFASVGVDDMFEILADANDLMDSPIGSLLERLGVTEKSWWFRGGEMIPPISWGSGPAGLPRLERQYFHFSAPIDVTRFAGRHEDRDACFELRKEVQIAIEHGVGTLLAKRDKDPERYLAQRMLRALAARLG